MANSSDLATTRVITRDGVVNATIVDKLSPDRLALVLFRGAIAAKYARVEDQTAIVSRDLKDLLIFPFSEL
jgi:hypothetical protein